MDKIRMKVLQEFSRNLDNQIVVGHPEHPDKNGRYVMVSQGAADVLEKAGLAEPYSLEDEAVDRALGKLKGTPDEDEDEDDDEDSDDEGSGNGNPANGDANTNVDGARTTDLDQNRSAQRVRERRTDTSGTRTGNKRRTPKGKGNKAPGDKASAPVGGNDTTASTNHPTQSIDGSGQSDATNQGANSEPDPDAPPQE